MMHDFSGTVKKSPEIMTIHTTLYDLSAALSAEVGPDEEDVLTAAFMHLLNTHRVTCTGNLKGYRLRACNAEGHTVIHRDGARPREPISEIHPHRERVEAREQLL